MRRSEQYVYRKAFYNPESGAYAKVVNAIEQWYDPFYVHHIRARCLQLRRFYQIDRAFSGLY